MSGSVARRSSGRGSSTSPGRSPVTAAYRSSRPRTCCRSGSASGTTRSSSGSSCRWPSSAPASSCCSCAGLTARAGGEPDAGPRARRRARCSVAWWVVPFILAVLVPADVAARGRPAATTDVAGREPAGPHPGRDRPRGARRGDRAATRSPDRRAVPVVVAVVLIARSRRRWPRRGCCVLWIEPVYAHLQLGPRPRARLRRAPGRAGAASHGPHVRGLVVARLVRDRRGARRRGATGLREAGLRLGTVHGCRQAERRADLADGSRGDSAGSSPPPIATAPIGSCSPAAAGPSACSGSRQPRGRAGLGRRSDHAWSRATAGNRGAGPGRHAADPGT